jgi:hypothetical protein
MRISSKVTHSQSENLWFPQVLTFGKSLFVGIFLFTLIAIPIEGAHDMESALSVVKITAKTASGQVNHATGFVWQQPTYVVTALHAVAGSEKITVYSEAKKKLSAATILRVLKKSDLALLEMERDLELTPLSSETVDPNSLDEFYIWGYPQNVNTMQGDYIRFSRSLNQEQPTLQSILKVSDELKKELEQQGFPAIDVDILRISSIIQPGHSGAPILSKEGAVVGIGDGGLRGGVARINWAIPAELYLPLLPDSQDDIPGQASLQAKLYSVSETQPAEPAVSVATTAGPQSLKKTLTTTLENIISTLPEESEKCQTLQEELEEFEEADIPIEHVQLNIYDNPEVGVSLAVPAEISLETQDDLFVFSSKAHAIRMVVKISNSGDREKAFVEAESFSKLVRQNTNWELDPDYKDMKDCSDDSDAEQPCYFCFFRVQYDADDEIIAHLEESWDISDGRFLGAAILTDLMKETPQQEDLLEILGFCLDYLVTFSIQ